MRKGVKGSLSTSTTYAHANGFCRTYVYIGLQRTLGIVY